MYGVLLSHNDVHICHMVMYTSVPVPAFLLGRVEDIRCSQTGLVVPLEKK